MNKAELIKAMAEKAEMSQADASKALKAFVDATKEELVKGESVSLLGFGTFSVSERAARTGLNPKTGEKIKIAAKKVMRFKASKSIEL